MLETIGRRARVALAVVFVSVLAACGGGGGGDSPAPGAATLALAADASTVVWNAAATLDVAANDSASSGALSLVSVSAPAHGTASISNGRIVYTPAAGYYGPDSFGYTAKADTGGATATAQVSVTVEAQLALAGTAKDAPLPGAAITVTVGGRTFTATAGADGAFEVTVRSASASDFIRIDAVGTGGTARLRTLVGEFGALVSAAAGSGRLDAAALARLDATHHSTAYAALAIAANGGTLPATAAQLDAALAKVSPSEALEMAALIQRVVDGGVPLPQGKADVWALVSDPGAYRSFLDGTVAADPDAFRAAQDATAASLPLAAPPAADELAGREIAYYSSGIGPDTAYLVSYFANGNAQVRGDFGTLVCTWQRSGSAITIDYPQPLRVISQSSDADPETGFPGLVEVTETQLVLRRQALAPSTWSATVVATQTYLDGSRQGQTASYRTAESPGFPVRAADFAARLPVAGSEFAEGRRWAGFDQSFYSGLDGFTRFAFLQDAFLLQAGGVASSLTDPATRYAVTVADDKVSIARTNFGTTFIANSYVRLAVEADGNERWLAMAPIVASPNGLGNGMVASIPVRPYTGAPLDTESAGRRWQASIDATSSVDHALYNDFTGVTTITVAGNPPDLTATTWQLQGPVLAMTSSLGDTRRVRSWLPLARDGAALSVLESISTQLDGQDPTVLVSRVRRVVDLGPAVK